MAKEKAVTDKKLLLFSIIISLIIIVIILYLTIDRDTFVIYLSKIKPGFFLLGLLSHVLSWFLWGLRLSFMSKMVKPECRITIRDGSSIAITNIFLAAVTPSMAGGEPIRIHLLSKKGLGTGCATAVVLGERIFDAIFILLLVPFAVIVFQNIISNNIIKTGLFIGLALFIIGILLFGYGVMRPEKVKKFLVGLDKLFEKILPSFRKKIDASVVLKKIDDFAYEFRKGAKFIFRMKNIKGVTIVFLITAAYWLAEFAVASFVLLGLNYNPIWIQSIAAQILLIIIIMIPLTPGSSGLAEGVGGLLYSTLVTKSLLGVFIFIWRFITFHINIIVGGIFQYKLFGSILPKKKYPNLWE
jgi:hypothetical protein